MAITFIALAVATAFFAILSSGLHLLDGHGKRQFEVTAELVLFFDSFLLTAFGTFTALAALTGFALGSQRTARLFGILWQTETPTRGEKWLLISGTIALLLTMAVYALRKLGVA